MRQLPLYRVPYYALEPEESYAGWLNPGYYFWPEDLALGLHWQPLQANFESAEPAWETDKAGTIPVGDVRTQQLEWDGPRLRQALFTLAARGDMGAQGILSFLKWTESEHAVNRFLADLALAGLASHIEN